MHQALEEGSQLCRTLHPQPLQGQAQHHAQEGQLVPGKEHLREAVQTAPLTDGQPILFQIEILGHGKDQEHQHDILAGADKLGIGKARLIVENEGADVPIITATKQYITLSRLFSID